MGEGEMPQGEFHHNLCGLGAFHLGGLFWF